MAGETNQPKRRLSLIIGAVIVILAFLVPLLVFRGSNSTTSSTVAVVVAKTNLPKGTQLTTDMVTQVQYPQASAPTDSFANPQDVSGRYLAIDVTANSPILASFARVTSADAQTTSLNTAPLAIDKGYVAMAIPLTGGGNNPGDASLVSVGYWIQPGDHLDIIVANSNSTINYSFQDVNVLKVGTNNSNSATANPTLLVIELPRQQAEEMALLMAKKVDASGNAIPNSLQVVSYVLRPRAEYGASNNNYENSVNPGVPTPPQISDPPVSIQNLTQLFNNK